MIKNGQSFYVATKDTFKEVSFFITIVFYKTVPFNLYKEDKELKNKLDKQINRKTKILMIIIS